MIPPDSKATTQTHGTRTAAACVQTLDAMNLTTVWTARLGGESGCEIDAESGFIASRREEKSATRHFGNAAGKATVVVGAVDSDFSQ
jgi:hypothetical protein